MNQQIQWDNQELQEARDKANGIFKVTLHKEIWLFRKGFRPIEPLEEGDFKEARN